MRLYLVRTDPVQQLAAHPDTLTLITRLIEDSTRPIAPELGDSVFFGWPLIPDPALRRDVVHLRPHPRPPEEPRVNDQPTPDWNTCPTTVDHDAHPWHDPWPLPHGKDAHCPGRPTPKPHAEQAAPVDWQAVVARRERELKTVGEQKQAVEAERDGAYRERAQLLALLASLHPSVIAPAPDVDEDGWQILYLRIDGKQASWHIAPRDADLYAHVEHVPADDSRAQWDGHTTEQKYAHIGQHAAQLYAEARGRVETPLTPAEAAVERARERCQTVRDRVGPGGMINASQILGLLSPTWPDGNYEAAAPAALDDPKEH